jgi:hypothetical protein
MLSTSVIDHGVFLHIPGLSGSPLSCVGNILGQEGAERFAAVNQEAGITRFARPSALIPFLA